MLKFKFDSNHFFSASLLLSITAVTLLILSGCNVYSFMSKPSGDKQLLSAARAAFDRGDYAEAADLYGKLSGDMADISNSESAFRILAENGTTMGDFIVAFGKGGSIGRGFKALAGTISKSAPDQTKRLKYLEAFQKVGLITGTELRGVVRLVTAASLASEILAEDVAGQGVFPDTKFATNVTTCLAANVGTCAGGACASTSSIVGAATLASNQLPTSGTTGMTGAANWAMFHAALKEVSDAMTEVNVSGSLGGDFSSLAGTILSVGAALTNSPACYRWGLLTNGFGG